MFYSQINKVIQINPILTGGLVFLAVVIIIWMSPFLVLGYLKDVFIFIVICIENSYNQTV